MALYFQLLTACALPMSVVALLFWLCVPLLLRRYRSRTAYRCCMLLAAGFLLPWRARIPVRIPVSPVMLQFPHPDAAGAPSGLESAAAMPEASASIPLAALILWGWAAGAAAVLLYQIWRHRRFLRRISRYTQPVGDPALTELFAAAAADLRIHRKVRFLSCPILYAPFGFSLLHPAVVIPAGMRAGQDSALLLRHELLHIKRLDAAAKLLFLLLRAICWWNPAALLLARQADLLCELSCDEETVQGAGTAERFAYVRALIEAAGSQRPNPDALTAGFLPKKKIEKRVVLMMQKSEKKAGLFLIAGVLLCTLLAGSALASSKEWESYEDSLARNLEPFAQYGISYDKEADRVYYNGEAVKAFVDLAGKKEREGGYSYWFRVGYLQDDGTLYLLAQRDENDRITGVGPMPPEMIEDLYGDRDSAKAGISPSPGDSPAKKPYLPSPGNAPSEKTYPPHSGATKGDALYCTYDAATYLLDGALEVTDKLKSNQIPKTLMEALQPNAGSENSGRPVLLRTPSGNNGETGYIAYAGEKRLGFSATSDGKTLTIHLLTGFPGADEAAEGPTVIRYTAPNTLSVAVTLDGAALSLYEIPSSASSLAK